MSCTNGRVAKWLCSGLQIRPRRFDSGLGLHTESPADQGLRGFFVPAKKGGCVPHFWQVFRIWGLRPTVLYIRVHLLIMSGKYQLYASGVHLVRVK